VARPVFPRAAEGVPAAGCRPRCEILEDRCLPSTFTVTTTNDQRGRLAPAQAILTGPTPRRAADLITFNIGGGGGVQDHFPDPRSCPRSTDPGHPSNGTTQPGFAGSPLIELKTAPAAGFNITAGNSNRSAGLVINRFQRLRHQASDQRQQHDHRATPSAPT